MDHQHTSRRNFIRQLSGSVGSTWLAFSAGGLIETQAGTYVQEKPLQTFQDDTRKLGIALVGLGKYATEQLAPALKETKHCKLTGIVTGSPDKINKWQSKYNISDKNVYNYQNFDSIKDNKEIDIVYIVLPNALHAEFTIRAAQAGKHVICEKPMAITVRDCEEMIAACEKANKLLSIGYRLHFEPHNLTMSELGDDSLFGKIKSITAKDGQVIDPNVWRLDRERAGGGPLMDVGIYCVQGAIYTMGKNPIAVMAREGPKTDLEKFKEVEQSLTWQMEFPGGVIASCETSYAEDMNLLRADLERGWYELKPAYAYKGITGKSNQGDLDLPKVNQQALQMDDFAQCVLQNKKSKVPGEMGLRDVRILQAIYEAARTGKRVELKNL
ncbi:MAG TPA: Gfo/Idh/MocA family oxidoreductase [Ohtaekwangia sp.]